MGVGSDGGGYECVGAVVFFGEDAEGVFSDLFLFSLLVAS